MGSLGMRVMHVVPTECDDFLVTMNCRLVVLMTVMAEQSFHEPCFGMVWIDIQDFLEKDLRDLPPFFGNGPSCMTSINANHRVILVGVVEAWWSKNSNV